MATWRRRTEVTKGDEIEMMLMMTCVSEGGCHGNGDQQQQQPADVDVVIG